MRATYLFFVFFSVSIKGAFAASHEPLEEKEDVELDQELQPILDEHNATSLNIFSFTSSGNQSSQLKNVPRAVFQDAIFYVNKHKFRISTVLATLLLLVWSYELRRQLKDVEDGLRASAAQKAQEASRTLEKDEDNRLNVSADQRLQGTDQGGPQGTAGKGPPAAAKLVAAQKAQADLIPQKDKDGLSASAAQRAQAANQEGPQGTFGGAPTAAVKSVASKASSLLSVFKLPSRTQVDKIIDFAVPIAFLVIVAQTITMATPMFWNW